MIKKILCLFMSYTPLLLSAQNVGIGTANPLMKLHVAKSDSALAILENTQALDVNVSNALYFKTGNGLTQYTGAVKTIGEGPGAARLGLFTYAAFNANSLKERLSITDGGNVGIGTTTPQTNLHINPNGAGALLIGSNRSIGGYTNIEMGISTQTNGYGYLQATKASGTSYGNLALNANGGNVGIGTTAPVTGLDVHGGLALPVKLVTDNYTVQNNDYTIVVDMQNSLNRNIDITLPGQFTNTGRVVKVIAYNMPNRGGGIAGGTSPNGKVDIYNGITLISSLSFAFWSDYHSNGNGKMVHTEFYDRTAAITLQCTGTAIGWIETDNIARNNYTVDTYEE